MNLFNVLFIQFTWLYVLDYPFWLPLVTFLLDNDFCSHLWSSKVGFQKKARTVL